MAKSSKKSKEVMAPEASSDAPRMETSNALGGTESGRPTGAKKATAKAAGRATTTGKSRSTTPRKAAAVRKPRAKKIAQRSTADGDATVTDREIQIRAYFISEWRMQNGIAGDSANDWLEARRQLQTEAGRA